MLFYNMPSFTRIISLCYNHAAVNWIHSFFSARQHICYSVLYAIARPSVCPSVCLSHGWISQKCLKLGSCNFHHRVAPWLCLEMMECIIILFFYILSKLYYNKPVGDWFARW